jgi:hypothetical protein
MSQVRVVQRASSAAVLFAVGCSDLLVSIGISSNSSLNRQTQMARRPSNLAAPNALDSFLQSLEV